MILPGYPRIVMPTNGGGGGGGGGSPTPLTRISSAVTTSQSSVYAPSGVLAGHLIVLIKTAQGLAAAPSTPSGFTLGYSAVNAQGTIYGRVLYRFAEADGETVNLGDVFNQQTAVYVFSGALTTGPIGDTDSKDDIGTSATFKALTMTNSRSFVVGAVKCGGGADEVPGTISGVATVGSSVGYKAFYVGPTSSFSSRSCTVETSGEPPSPPVTVRWLTLNVEIVSAV